MSMLSPLPATEVAFRDTLVQKAQGAALDDLLRMYRLPRPGVLAIDSWRAAVKAVLFGPRGTRGNMHAFLEAALSQFGTTYHCSVTPVNPQRLTWINGGTDGGFTAAHVNRLFRVDYSRGSAIFRSQGPTFNAGPAVLGYVDLCPVRTGYWDAASFPEVEDVSVTLLPFVWSDTDAQFFLWADMNNIVPPTYIQPSVRWAASSILALPPASSYPYPGDAYDHPEWHHAAPLIDFSTSGYIVTAETAGTWRNLIVNADTDGIPARGDSYTITLQKKVAGVYVNTLLTCSLGAALKTASDMVNSVALVEGDDVVLKVTPGAAATAPMVWPRAAVYIDKPIGQPTGGEVLDTAWVDGNQATGPWPLYLGDTLDAELVSILYQLLAAGVILRGYPAVFDELNGLP